MPSYDYLIIGGGMTADATIRGIREIDASSSIGMISAEDEPPYNRPPLSKALWKGEPLSEIWRDTPALGVDLHLGRSATNLSPNQRTLSDDVGNSYTYGKLLLATGGTPRRLRGRDDGVVYFRTLDDYRRLRELTAEPRRVAVIGGGYIGAEIAAAMGMNGHEVHMFFPEATLLTRLLPTDLASYLGDYYRSKGVALHPASSIKGVVEHNGGYRISVGGVEDSDSDFDVVIAGLGLMPNTEIAEAAGLDVNDGISVDKYLRTSNHHIFAAGDVANVYDPILDRHVRAEHEDNANTMGRHAGRAMAGEEVPYVHLPYFYSDLFEAGFEGVGRVDSRLSTVSRWERPFEEGIIYYLDRGRVQGVLLWNTWGKMEEARELIRTRRPATEASVPDLLVGA